nr:MAG TPA: hypothetical protein [Caudoviricetes sp.]
MLISRSFSLASRTTDKIKMRYEYEEDPQPDVEELLVSRIYGRKPQLEQLTEISQKMGVTPDMMKAIIALLHAGTRQDQSIEEHVYMGCMIIDDMIAREDNFGFLETVSQWVTTYKDMILHRHRIKDVIWLAHLGQLTNPYLYIEQILVALAVSGVISIQYARRLNNIEYEYLDLLLAKYGLN